MVVYELSPIDMWAGWLTEEKYIRQLQKRDMLINHGSGTVDGFHKFKEKALAVAKAKLHFEGDFTQGPYFAGIPGAQGNSYCSFIMGWKQSNNGSTFIASPYDLPWLDEDARKVRA